MMADGPSQGADSNLAKFVRELSEGADRQEEFSADPERAMEAAGLSEEEKEILRRGDEQEILNAIGIEKGGILLMIRIRNMRFGI
jgi:hypothetical protein